MVCFCLDVLVKKSRYKIRYISLPIQLKSGNLKIAFQPLLA